MDKRKSVARYFAFAIVILIAIVLFFYKCSGEKPIADQQDEGLSGYESEMSKYVSEIKCLSEYYAYNTKEGWIAWWTPDGYLRFMTTHDSVPYILHSPNPNEPCKSVYNVTRNNYEKLIFIDHVIPTPDSTAFILFYPNSPEFFEMNETPYRLLSFPSLTLVNVSTYTSLRQSDLVSSVLVKDLTDYKQTMCGNFKLVYRCLHQYNTKGEFVSSNSTASLFIYDTDCCYELIDIPNTHLNNYYYKKALIRIFDSFLNHLGKKTFNIEKATQQCINDIKYLNEFDEGWNRINSYSYSIWESLQDAEDAMYDLDEIVGEIDDLTDEW